MATKTEKRATCDQCQKEIAWQYPNYLGWWEARQTGVAEGDAAPRYDFCSRECLATFFASWDWDAAS